MYTQPSAVPDSPLGLSTSGEDTPLTASNATNAFLTGLKLAISVAKEGTLLPQFNNLRRGFPVSEELVARSFLLLSAVMFDEFL